MCSFILDTRCDPSDSWWFLYYIMATKKILVLSIILLVNSWLGMVFFICLYKSPWNQHQHVYKNRSSMTFTHGHCFGCQLIIFVGLESYSWYCINDLIQWSFYCFMFQYSYRILDIGYIIIHNVNNHSHVM